MNFKVKVRESGLKSWVTIIRERQMFGKEKVKLGHRDLNPTQRTVLRICVPILHNLFPLSENFICFKYNYFFKILHKNREINSILLNGLNKDLHLSHNIGPHVAQKFVSYIFKADSISSHK